MKKQGNNGGNAVASGKKKKRQNPHPTKILSLIAIFGISYFGLIILLLSLFDRDYNPISQAASDYGVGRFALEMNAGFFVAGLGIIAFALALNRTKWSSRAGSILLSFAGLVLIMDSYFTTNIEEGSPTMHGTIHGFGGLPFFISAPVGTLLASRRFGRKWLVTILSGMIVGFITIGANINAGGLGERLILLVIFSTVIVASLNILKSSKTGYLF
jgi:hypothetical membrane protein